MAKLVEELRQHALMIANDIRRLHNLDIHNKKAAYQRATSLHSVSCPNCWVKNGETSKLEIDAYANDTNLYICKKCGFNAVLPKAEQT